MSLFDELNEAPQTSEGIKEIPEGKYHGKTAGFTLEKSQYHAGQVLMGYIEVDVPGLGKAKSLEAIDLQNPSGRAQAVKQLSGILKNGLAGGNLPSFMQTEKSELIVMAKLAELLSSGVPVHVEIKHKRDKKTGEKKVSAKGYTACWNNFLPLDDGQDPLGGDDLPF